MWTSCTVPAVLHNCPFVIKVNLYVEIQSIILGKLQWMWNWKMVGLNSTHLCPYNANAHFVCVQIKLILSIVEQTHCRRVTACCRWFLFLWGHSGGKVLFQRNAWRGKGVPSYADVLWIKKERKDFPRKLRRAWDLPWGITLEAQRAAVWIGKGDDKFTELYLKLLAAEPKQSRGVWGK